MNYSDEEVKRDWAYMLQNLSVEVRKPEVKVSGYDYCMEVGVPTVYGRRVLCVSVSCQMNETWKDGTPA